MGITKLTSPEAAGRWLKEWVTGTLRSDSRQVQPGDGFIAWPGHATDGRQFARAALAAGASTCLVERQGVETFAFVDARIASLPQLKASTGFIADAYFDQPSAALDVVATTGTNGKTSTAWWTAQALTALGRRCGVIGTLGVGEPPAASSVGAEPPVGDTVATIEFTGLTTPDPVKLHATLRRFVDDGLAACAMEASSIGIVEQRLAGVRVKVALLTNFTRDHLDYHGTMDAYWAAKRELFAWPGLRAAVLNVDDERGAALASELLAMPEGERLDVWTYAVDVDGQSAKPARLRAEGVTYVDGGLVFDAVEHGGDRARVESRLIGDYNASNLLAVMGGLRALGVPLADVARVVPGLTPVPGRMQRVTAATRSPQAATTPQGGLAGPAVAQPDVVVDYAHTPDALEKVLRALRPLAAARGGRLWCVFGCGGNRDASKRPMMGAIAAQWADHVVLTSDNPRHEAPGRILRDIEAGVPAGASHVRTIEDRRVAIAEAVHGAAAADVVVLAGKGHEDYQEIEGVKQPFSDIDEARIALTAREAVGAAARVPA